MERQRDRERGDEKSEVMSLEKSGASEQQMWTAEIRKERGEVWRE